MRRIWPYRASLSDQRTCIEFNAAISTSTFGKRTSGNAVGANAFRKFLNALPTTQTIVNGIPVEAVVDTGATRTVIAERLIPHRKSAEVMEMKVAGGGSVKCQVCNVQVQISGRTLNVLACVMKKVIPGKEMLIGMDLINRVGGVSVNSSGKVKFGERVCTMINDPKYSITDKDFDANFDGNKWEVSWKVTEEVNESLSKAIDHYKIDEEITAEYENEIQKWIENKWLIPYSGPIKAKLPLMAIAQANKAKVRPVIDYRKLNEFVSSHSAEADVCHEKLRMWRKLGSDLAIVDLRSAYLQISVDQRLWKYQVIRFGGRTYALTRLGFGLNVAPKIMTAIVRHVLSIDNAICNSTDSYIDDILVDTSKVSAADVVRHLAKFGLEAKEPQILGECRVLGLKTVMKKNEVHWERDNVLPELHQEMTKRQLFSWSGSVLGHFPVAGKLRIISAYLKRICQDGSWDKNINKRKREILCISERYWKKMVCRYFRRQLHLVRCKIIEDSKGSVIENGAWLRKRLILTCQN